MKEARSPHPAIVFEERLIDAATAVRNGGTVTAVTFLNGVGTLNGSSAKIVYGKIIAGVRTVRVKFKPTTTTQSIVKLTSSHSVSATSGTLAATGFSSPTIYVNGVAGTTITAGWNDVVITTATAIKVNALIIGQISSYFSGEIDLVQFYNTALTAEDVKLLYNNALPSILVADINFAHTAKMTPAYKAAYNNIGTAGDQGFGVGVCPPDLLKRYNLLNPTAMVDALPGTGIVSHDDYGNYKCRLDNSIMVWIPFFWAKIDGNDYYVKNEYQYTSESAARKDGYFIPRMFINGGKIQRGVFMDKYSPSLTGATLDASGSVANTGILSSIKNANPISSSADTLRKLTTGSDNLYAGSFANCRYNSKTPANAYYGGIDAVKSRGASYHVMTAFQRQGLFILAKAHQRAASGTTYCAWNGVSPYFPKGNNNYGADYNDATCTFSACDDGYWGAKTGSMEARKCGSGSTFAKTTHNGQNCGIADVNGNQHMFLMGITSIAESAQAITAISRAAEAVVTVTNAAASKSNYYNGKPVMINGSAATEWNALLKDKIFVISDLSGNTFKIKNQAGAYINSSALSADYTSGLNSTTGKFYILKESVDVKLITSGASAATDHWGATGISAMYDEVTLLLAGSIGQRLGSGTNQVFSGETSRAAEAYKLSAALLPMSLNSYDGSGTTAFGNDYYYNYIIDNLALRGFCSWGHASGAGLAACSLSSARTSASRDVSVRACLYLV